MNFLANLFSVLPRTNFRYLPAFLAAIFSARFFLGDAPWNRAENLPLIFRKPLRFLRSFYHPADYRWFIEGQYEFNLERDKQEFMRITNQMIVYNWFRFVLARFQ
jgi:hypothetical protein